MGVYLSPWHPLLLVGRLMDFRDGPRSSGWTSDMPTLRVLETVICSKSLQENSLEFRSESWAKKHPGREEGFTILMRGVCCSTEAFWFEVLGDERVFERRLCVPTAGSILASGRPIGTRRRPYGKVADILVIRRLPRNSTICDLVEKPSWPRSEQLSVAVGS